MTKAVESKVGVSRQWLYWACKVLRFAPQKIIVDGRAHNDYSDEQVKALQGFRKSQ
jgi:hypothetical protein